MKNLLIPAFAVFFLFVGCKGEKKEQQKDESTPNETQTSAPVETIDLCFLSTGKDIKREDRVIRDSTILTLRVEQKKARGIFNWFPAEKDGRSGTFEGTMKDGIILGKYTFNQEGMTETQDIRIEITDNEAKITTNPGKEGAFVLTAEKTDCTH
ncbi:hypothetical protein [Sinomicrobium sp. M5D2P17]